MEIFRSLVGGGGEAKGAAHDASGAETVERLVERLTTSTLLDDRRDACRALKSLSRKYRVEVGAQAMDAILKLFEFDRIDTEIMTYAVECLLNVTSPELLEDEDPSHKGIGEQFTEIISKKQENIANLLSLFEEYDYKIRLPLIKLFTNMLENRPKDVQEILLVSPMGVSKIMDLLSDAREFIRNEAILLLIALTKNNTSIQKIIAFENGFDRILQVIQEEGYSEGGPVVEDCVQVLLNLLKNNSSNQTFFREGNYIKKLVPFFQIPVESKNESEEGWPTQKVSNFYHMLRVVRTLVSPLNPSHVTVVCQKAMNSCGILKCLCSLILANGIPSDTLTEAIATVAEVMRGNHENQDYFYSVEAPSDPPRPVFIILLMSLCNERQPLSLRSTVLYCVQCYLFKNERSQNLIVSSLLPSSTSDSSSAAAVSPGQILCSGLLHKDVTNNWLSAIALSHALLDSSVQKEALLKVQLMVKPNTPAVTLMAYLISLLQQTTKWQVKVGILQLLAIWLENAPPPVITNFLSNQSAIPFLVNQVTSPESDEKEALVKGLSAFIVGLCLYFNPNTVEAYTKENLVHLINNRIRMETLSDSLGHVSKSDFYLHALKHPQLNVKHSTDLVFDNSFCVLFKKFESLILLQITDPHHGQNRNEINGNDISNLGHMVNTKQSPNDVISQYKEFIRTQDETIEKLKQEVQQITGYNLQYKVKFDEMHAENVQLRHQLALFQAHQDAFDVRSQQNVIGVAEHHEALAAKDAIIQQLRTQLQTQNSGVTHTRSPIQQELITKLEEENKLILEELEKSKKDQDELLELLTEQDNRISSLKALLRLHNIPVENDDDDQDDLLDSNFTVGNETETSESLLQ